MAFFTETVWRSTPAASGVSITRDGKSYTVSWKLGASDLAEQALAFRFNNNGEWIYEVSVGAGETAKTLSEALINKWLGLLRISGNYQLNVAIRGIKKSGTEKYKVTVKKKVNGKTKKVKETRTRTVLYTYSEWAFASYQTQYPKVPNLGMAPGDTAYEATFSWETPDAEPEKDTFATGSQGQTMLVANCKETDGSRLNWNGATTGTYGINGSQNVQETSSVVAEGTHTRWFRVRSYSENIGYSGWQYSKRVYAYPFQTVITEATASRTEAGYNCRIRWNATINAEHPAEEASIEYAMVTPEANMEYTSDSGWNEAKLLKAASGAQAATFTVSGALGEDKCLFMRANLTHEENTTYGRAALASVGFLKAPEITNVSRDQSTFRATITGRNNSGVPGSFLAVYYKEGESPNQLFPVGIIPAGETTTTVQCPDWTGKTVTFGVKAIVGSYSQQTREDGVSVYNFSTKMGSRDIVWLDTTVPQAPSIVTAMQVEGASGTVRVSWDWSWSLANIAQISWADHPDAWESTDEAEDYEVSNIHASAWNIAGLEIGKKWYIRVRLIQERADGRVIGDWSEPLVEINLSSAPQRPELLLSEGTTTAKGTITASWAYISTDTTPQAYAEVREATITPGGVTPGRILATTETAQHAEINIEETGWQTGTTHHIIVMTVSGSGQSSPWSNPVSVTVAEPLTAEITGTSLVEEEITEDETTRTVMSLKAMPLTVTVTGAGVAGKVIVAVERAAAYRMARPDERTIDGFEGETIAQAERTGDGEITIDVVQLLGRLDDEAKYRIVAYVKDDYGQSDQTAQDFEVHWTEQAKIPSVTTEVDDDSFIAKITPDAEDPGEDAVCDIYRLSADRPELIVSGATFGETYVDPYPAMGNSGGHRVVYKTADGDYITEDDLPAWADSDEEDYLEDDCMIIDFGKDQVKLYGNLDLNNQWAKRFTQTTYLGGSVQGDWNEGTGRSGSAGSTVITLLDEETIRQMRRLAVYAGACHVRTPDGSSFTANVDVNETRDHSTERMQVSFSISYTRVDSATLDGMTLDEWNAQQEEE